MKNERENTWGTVPKLQKGYPAYDYHRWRSLLSRVCEFSVEVNGNWRVVFKVEEPNVLDVDLEDYH